MELNPDDRPYRSNYKLLTGAIVPRPIGWISTINREGQANLAPFSYFNAVCASPPTLLFCPGVRGSDGQPKDTLRNVQETGEFVVNIVTEATVEAMNITSTEFPSDVDEFQAAELTMAPSLRVRPPRVAELPIHFECTVDQIIVISDQPGGGAIVIGRVMQIHVQDDLLFSGDKINVDRLKPIGRLAGWEYCRVTDRFELPRPASQIKPRI